MRILYFSRGYTTHDWNFLTAMARSRHEISFARLEMDGAHEKRPLPEGVRSVSWQGARFGESGPQAWLRLMPDFESVLEQVRPDLIHAGPVQSCGFMAAMSGFHPFVVMSWGSDILVDTDRDPLWHWITRYTLERSDMFVCDCQAVRTRVKDLVPYGDERIIQFPWGVDLRMFAPGAGNLGWKGSSGDEGRFVILSTRSWEPIYGIDILLEAFRKAHARNPLLSLVMLGDGSMRDEVERFIGDHGLEEAVSLPGRVIHGDLPAYFRSADCYISCAYSDGTSVSLLEAMATGLPVVVTDTASNREWINPGENGWLAPAGDSSVFADTLLLVAGLDGPRRQEVGRKNRRVVEERADWGKNIKRLLEAYDRIESGDIR